MNSQQLKLLVIITLLTTTLHAAEVRVNQPKSPDVAMRSLAPVQVNIIRTVGRNILAAKKSGIEDSTDNEEIMRLRTSVDQLINADLQTNPPSQITIQEQESSEKRKLIERASSLQRKASGDARAMTTQLRNRNLETKSAGIPIGDQRAQMFENWADKLDAALADEGADRIIRLQALREQLNTTKGSISEVSNGRGTPTIQAMPAGYVPIGNSDVENKE